MDEAYCLASSRHDLASGVPFPFKVYHGDGCYERRFHEARFCRMVLVSMAADRDHSPKVFMKNGYPRQS